MALAIVCSFLLGGGPLLLAQTPAPCAKKTHACCACGGKMACCQSGPVSGSQPAPAAPASAGNQVQLSLLAPGLLAWTLPVNPANSISSISTPLSMAAGAPLFARNCARLI